jgi:hypothetical protein
VADSDTPPEGLPEELRDKEILRRYKNPDGTYNASVADIIAIEKQCKQGQHDPCRIDPNNWDGKPSR